MQGPSLIFDKSSLESLNLDEAVFLDNFYMSNITPLFFVECLADLEKSISSKSTPEQLVGSLANRTPDLQSSVNVHHMDILRGELSGTFDLRRTFERPLRAGGRRVRLGDMKGVIFKMSNEQEAIQRWMSHDFLEVERNIAKHWRRSLTQIDFTGMVKTVMAKLGHWRKPTSLSDARRITDAVIDFMDSEWLLRYGLELLGVSEATDRVVSDWINRRRPPIRERFPYFVLMLSITIFFCLVLPTQLLKNVKATHQVDLAYLYYLPFCSVFTSKDNFHAQIVPLFLDEHQTFVNGTELKEDLKRLVQHYSALPDEMRRSQGLMGYARVPPDDQSFLITRLWDKYLPNWRAIPPKPDVVDPEIEKVTLEEIKRLTKSPELEPHDEHDIDELAYVSVQRKRPPEAVFTIQALCGVLLETFGGESVDPISERNTL